MRRCTIRILGIGAHVDDLQLCAGGTFLKLSEERHQIEVLYTCDFSGSNMTVDGWQESLRLVGAKGMKILNFGWMKVKDTPALREEINSAMEQFQPDLIFTHYPKDSHPDHLTTGKVVLEIAIERGKSRAVYFFGVPNTVIDFVPDVYVDISDRWEKKVKSLGLLTGISKDPEAHRTLPL